MASLSCNDLKFRWKIEPIRKEEEKLKVIIKGEETALQRLAVQRESASCRKIDSAGQGTDSSNSEIDEGRNLPKAEDNRQETVLKLRCERRRKKLAELHSKKLEILWNYVEEWLKLEFDRLSAENFLKKNRSLTNLATYYIKYPRDIVNAEDSWRRAEEIMAKASRKASGNALAIFEADEELANNGLTESSCKLETDQSARPNAASQVLSNKPDNHPYLEACSSSLVEEVSGKISDAVDPNSTKASVPASGRQTQSDFDFAYRLHLELNGRALDVQSSGMHLSASTNASTKVSQTMAESKDKARCKKQRSLRYSEKCPRNPPEIDTSATSQTAPEVFQSKPAMKSYAKALVESKPGRPTGRKKKGGLRETTKGRSSSKQTGHQKKISVEAVSASNMKSGAIQDAKSQCNIASLSKPNDKSPNRFFVADNDSARKPCGARDHEKSPDIIRGQVYTSKSSQAKSPGPSQQSARLPATKTKGTPVKDRQPNERNEDFANNIKMTNVTEEHKRLSPKIQQVFSLKNDQDRSEITSIGFNKDANVSIFNGQSLATDTVQRESLTAKYCETDRLEPSSTYSDLTNDKTGSVEIKKTVPPLDLSVLSNTSDEPTVINFVGKTYDNSIILGEGFEQCKVDSQDKDANSLRRSTESLSSSRGFKSSVFDFFFQGRPTGSKLPENFPRFDSPRQMHPSNDASVGHDIGSSSGVFKPFENSWLGGFPGTFSPLSPTAYHQHPFLNWNNFQHPMPAAAKWSPNKEASNQLKRMLRISHDEDSNGTDKRRLASDIRQAEVDCNTVPLPPIVKSNDRGDLYSSPKSIYDNGSAYDNNRSACVTNSEPSISDPTPLQEKMNYHDEVPQRLRRSDSDEDFGSFFPSSSVFDTRFGF